MMQFYGKEADKLMTMLAEAATTVGDLHDASRGVSAWSAFGALTAILVAAIAALLLLVRRSDMKVVERAEAALTNLVHEIAGFRADLSHTRETFIRDYALKIEVEKLDRKVEKLRDHMAVRATERRAVADGEAS